MAVLLRIVDWEKHFENNRTRELKVLHWVPIPNKLDGDGYTEVLSHKNGAAHYGAWVAIVLIASKCEPRGTLLRGLHFSSPDGVSQETATIPHSSATLSRISRIPVRVFDEVIPRLLQVGWLEEVTSIPQDSAGISQEGATIPQSGAASCAGAGASRTERNGTERNGTELPVPVPAPSPQDLKFSLEDTPGLRDALQRLVAPLPVPERMMKFGIFPHIKPRHLREPLNLVCWFRMQLSAKEPIAPGNQAYVLLVLAAAIHAVGFPVAQVKKTRVAIFVNIVSHGRWQRVAHGLPLAEKQLKKLLDEYGPALLTESPWNLKKWKAEHGKK